MLSETSSPVLLWSVTLRPTVTAFAHFVARGAGNGTMLRVRRSDGAGSRRRPAQRQAGVAGDTLDGVAVELREVVSAGVGEGEAGGCAVVRSVAARIPRRGRGTPRPPPSPALLPFTMRSVPPAAGIESHAAGIGDPGEPVAEGQLDLQHLITRRCAIAADVAEKLDVANRRFAASPPVPVQLCTTFSVPPPAMSLSAVISRHLNAE